MKTMKIKLLGIILVIGMVILPYATQVESTEEKSSKQLVCPVTKFPDCQACHSAPTGVVMDSQKGIRILNKVVYLYVERMDHEYLRRVIRTLDGYPYEKVVLDLFSFGGSVFDSLAMASFLNKIEAEGKIIEVQARGLVASAGLVILVSGTPGHRFIDKHSLVMFHELSTFKFLATETTSDQEEQARIVRRIQNTINGYITSRSKIDPDELRNNIKKKELWLNAEEAIKYGFADKVL